MGTLLQFYTSSVGKKLAVGLTGLFLCSFLVVHLGINLFLFAGDGGESYNMYAEFMATNPLIKMLEVVLVVGFLLHIFTSVILWFKNRSARPERYAMYDAAASSELSSRVTLLTGSVVFMFLVIHLRTFWFGSRYGNEAGYTMYQLVMRAFGNPVYDLLYITSFVILGYHLRHGFQSAFQTFGINNSRYTRLIELIAAIFWLVVPILFAAIPLYFLRMHYMTGGIV
ncbi:MAG: succinate dehydrogenase cytochrome b subunit [Ignavibacteriales bacterium]|nr:succinate dehydrogenase cytochrome b subunit [Ignavibacteriales bacterium]